MLPLEPYLEHAKNHGARESFGAFPLRRVVQRSLQGHQALAINRTALGDETVIVVCLAEKVKGERGHSTIKCNFGAQMCRDLGQPGVEDHELFALRVVVERLDHGADELRSILSRYHGF